MWITPIYDRTVEDIEYKTPKAYLNVADLNRIENNIKYLADTFSVQIETKEWGIMDIPLSFDFERIEENIEKIKAKIGKAYWNLPALPINTFEKVNDIEHLLKVIHDDEEKIVSSRIYTNESNYAGDYLI